MKIATYNIWNSDKGMPGREKQIIDEINSLDADFIALQEVRNISFFEKLSEMTDYKYSHFEPHGGRVTDVEPWRQREGLAVLSKYPVESAKYVEYALFIAVEHKGNTILLINVHLPWDSVLAQEKCIMEIMAAVPSVKADYRFILGDFNCSDASSVHQYIKGLRSLDKTEVEHYWTDLSLVAEEFLGVEREMTLDLMNNPRWKGKPLTDNSARVDCIFIHDCFPNPYPELKNLGYFGKKVDEETGFCASDHYGVFADLTMPYEKL